MAASRGKTLALLAGAVVVWFVLLHDGCANRSPTPQPTPTLAPPLPTPTVALPQSSPVKPHDDLTHFISKYGPPDSEYRAEDEIPRPPIPTRWLIYVKEDVRAVYLPADTRFGAPPTYKKWNFVAFQ